MLKGIRSISILICLMTLLCTPLSASSNEVALYVSKAGQDSNKGSEDAPLVFIQEAKERVAAMMAAGVTDQITVHIRGGVYYLEEPVIFEAKDSGTSTAPITYKAYQGEKVTLTGARPLNINEWQSHDGTIKKAYVGTGLDIGELFVNGEKQILARYPNYEEEKILNGYVSASQIKQRSYEWSDPKGGYIRALHQNRWGGNSYIIKGKNSSSSLGLSYQWIGDNNRGSGMSQSEIMVENIFEELDANREWYYDQEVGYLYYYPESGGRSFLVLPRL